MRHTGLRPNKPIDVHTSGFPNQRNLVPPSQRIRVRPGGRIRGLVVAVLVFGLLTPDQAAGQQRSEDATLACGRAAAQAERAWHIPTGLLAAIGMIESGRRAPAEAFPIIWPWTINAEGRGFYLPSKAAAVGMVRALQRRGVRVIDVGCFQIDLFYHPSAFSGLEEAFDPDANARAAARILSLGRLRSTGWGLAIAAYHSAFPLIGAVYLQKVQAVWPRIRAHFTWGTSDLSVAYTVLLSPQAGLVRVVTPLDAASDVPEGFPRVILAESQNSTDHTRGIIQWMHRPAADLPRVLLPSDSSTRLSPR